MAGNDDYPAEWESDVVLADGGTVLVRPIRPGEDDERLADLYSRQSDESIYFRFFSPVPRPTAPSLERRTPLDYHDHMMLVALQGDEMVAIARYDELDASGAGSPREAPATRPTAEVAFTVRDDQHGRGIATLLLEHLATVARTNGVERFTASVLPANRPMLGVFRDAGFEIAQQLADGAVEVTFDIEPTVGSRAASDQREQRAEARSMARLLAPRSVAVVGAGRDAEGIGRRVLENLKSRGFTGSIYPVNPSARSIAGLRAYPDLGSIPDEIELVVAAVPAASIPAVVTAAAQRSVHAVIVLSAGFAELGEVGRVAEGELVKVARSNGVRLVGPNSIGIVNTHPEVSMHAVATPFVPPRGPVAILSQSGALGIPLMGRICEEGSGISAFVSVGNRADVSGNDLLQFWEDDPQTGLIVLYLESFGNPHKFARIARRVSRSKPIIAVKSGRGASAARTDSSASSATDETVDSLFRQAGVIRVDTLEQLFDTTRVLVHQPLPAGRRVAVVANAATPAVLGADACEAAGLEVPELSEATVAALKRVTPEGVHVSNPVDLGFDAGEAEFAAALEIILADAVVDAVIVTYLAPFEDRSDPFGRTLARAGTGTKPVLACFLGRSGTPPTLGDEDRRIPTFAFPENAAQALVRAARRAEWLRRPQGREAQPDRESVERARAIVRELLTPGESRVVAPPRLAHEICALFGIETVTSHHVHDETEAVAAAESLGGPFALRAVASALAHPSDVGAVRLGLGSPEEARAAFAATTAAARAAGAEVDGALVQPMVARGVDTVVGCATDEAFGPVVGIAIAGIAADLLGDSAVHILPVTDRDAAEMVRSLRAAPLLFGYRGSPPADTGALERVLVGVGLAAQSIPEIEVLVLDPLIVGIDGAVATNVRLSVVRRTRPPAGSLRRLRRS